MPSITYANTHGIRDVRSVATAESGSSDYQFWLASEILTRSTQSNRAEEALKWLLLAYFIKTTGKSQADGDEVLATIHFVISSISEEEKNQAFALCESWLIDKGKEFSEGGQMLVPEIRTFFNLHGTLYEKASSLAYNKMPVGCM